jgi:hypothetical protein
MKNIHNDVPFYILIFAAIYVILDIIENELNKYKNEKT